MHTNRSPYVPVRACALCSGAVQNYIEWAWLTVWMRTNRIHEGLTVWVRINRIPRNTATHHAGVADKLGDMQRHTSRPNLVKFFWELRCETFISCMHRPVERGGNRGAYWYSFTYGVSQNNNSYINVLSYILINNGKYILIIMEMILYQFKIIILCC